MSFILRHGAEKLGLNIEESGFVNVKELLECAEMQKNKVTFEELLMVVKQNDKKRFEMKQLVKGSQDPIDY